MITTDELAEALKRARVWLAPDEQPGVAYRGYILHPEDAARDIMLAVQLVRGEK